MNKIKNTGFTIVELVVSFALISIIVIGMLTLALRYRNDASISIEQLEIVKYKDNITRAVQDDILELGIDTIEKTDNTTLTLTFDDGSQKVFKVDVFNKIITYDNRKFELNDIDERMTMEAYNFFRVSQQFDTDNIVYNIDIPIYHADIEGDFGIHILATRNIYEPEIGSPDSSQCIVKKDEIVNAINELGGSVDDTYTFQQLGEYIQNHLSFIPDNYTLTFSGNKTTGSNANSTYGLPVNIIDSQDSNFFELNGTTLVANVNLPASTLAMTIDNAHLDTGMGGTTTHVISVLINGAVYGNTVNMTTAHYGATTTNSFEKTLPALSAGDIISFKFKTGGRNGTSKISAASITLTPETTGEDTVDDNIINMCEKGKNYIIDAINNVGGTTDETFSFIGLGNYMKNHLLYRPDQYRLVFSGNMATGSRAETTYDLPVNTILSQTSDLFTLNGTTLVTNTDIPASSLSMSINNKHLDTGMGGTTIHTIRVYINGEQYTTTTMSTGYYGAAITNDALFQLPAMIQGTTLSFKFTTGGRNGTSQITSSSLLFIQE